MICRNLLICICAILAPGTTALAQISRPGEAEIRARAVARERWELKGRVMPGNNSAALRAKAVRQKVAMRALQLSAGTQAGAWQSLGPLPLPSASGAGTADYGWVSGRATAVAIDPNDPTGNTVFVGGANSGVWKSVNAGPASTDPASVSWAALSDGEATLAIGAIAVQPQLSSPNPSLSVVLAGTGETNSSADSYYGLGLLRSGDGGHSWTLISQDATGAHSFAGLGFSKIVFSAANPNLVVAATASSTQGLLEGRENPVALSRGIYFSTDAGLTWNAANIADAGVTISPASVTSVAYNAAAGKFFGAVRSHGFYSSLDGINWTRLTSQPGNEALTSSACPAQEAQPGICSIYRGEIAVVPNRAGPSGNGEMYAWFVDADSNDQGIWKTLDGGASWSQVNDSGITNCGDTQGCGTLQGVSNLALAAVPDGTATDIYAGALNLYKCTITNAFPFCNGTGNNSFLNLTHVYGCSDIANVHPAQHALDFLVANGMSLLYVANDGGIYRALDGFLGVRSGTCGQSNHFDSLNATLGPMAHFVSFAQSQTDPDLLFGGTQGNGAPATAFLQSGGPWVNVEEGDAGFTAINTANENEWFVSTPPDAASGVNVFRCSNGVSCRAFDFDHNQIANSSQLDGDSGAFHLPFILDPATPGSLLMGTCRVWRGSSTGGNLTLLSPNFETDGTGVCSGNEVNLVRSLAAGGPVDSSGFSQTVYVGTDGNGPLLATNPSGGHVWVTTSANDGPGSWSDRSGTINPNHFPISAISLDPADTTGQTAYLTIMGFGTPHVWRTADAGISWTDFTANLPDVPVNSIVIDTGTSGVASTVYVGTDVGVFATSSDVANWTELDPPAGQPGFLPGVAVTALRIFDAGGLKRLRAATYGRGIWEWNLITTPDFQLSVTNNPQTVFAGSNAVFKGSISAINGYNSSVNLSCVAGGTPAPQTCLVTPPSVSPDAAGTVFTVSGADAPGDYSFNVQAAGTDAQATTHTFALTMHVIDFNLSVPTPSTVMLVRGASSTPVSFTVSAAGAFNAVVALSCSGLPQGTDCQFQPSSSVTPTSGNPVAVTLIVSSQASTPVGSSQVQIEASAANGPSKTQPLTLDLAAAADYLLAISNPSVTTHVNSPPATFQGTITALNGYNGTITLTCGAGAPPTCQANPPTLIPSSAGTPFTVTVASGASQNFIFSINAVGSDGLAISHSVPVSLSVLPAQNFDFTMGVDPQSASVPDGQATTYMLDVNPGAANFPDAVTFACANLPQFATCSFNPTQVGAGTGNATVAMTIATVAPSGRTNGRFAATLIFAFPVAGFFWIGLRDGARKRAKTARILLGIVLALFSTSCGGGLQGNGVVGGSGIGTPGTPKGTYNVTITANAGSVSHSTKVSLTVQ